MEDGAQDQATEFSPGQDSLKVSDEQIRRLLKQFEGNLQKGQLSTQTLRKIVSAFGQRPSDIEPILGQVKEIIASNRKLDINYEIIPEDKLIGLRVDEIIGFFSFDSETQPSFYEVLSEEKADSIAAQTGQLKSYLRRVSWKKFREVIVLWTVYSEPIDLVELYRKKTHNLTAVTQ